MEAAAQKEKPLEQPSGQHESLDDYGVEEESRPSRGTQDRPNTSNNDTSNATENVPQRIHIIGTGSIGKLVAHSLRGISNPPSITLIFHRYRLLEAWEHSQKEITVQEADDENVKVSRGGFDVEIVPEIRSQHGVELQAGHADVYDVAGEQGRPHEAAAFMKDLQARQGPAQAQKAQSEAGSNDPGATVGNTSQDGGVSPTRRRYHSKPGYGAYARSNEPIQHLIVAAKAPLTVTTLSSIKHRLSANTSICFLQNGMGVADEVNEKLFPDAQTRPQYVQGIITHGANVPPHIAEVNPFYVVHAGHGTIALSPIPESHVRPKDEAQEAPNQPKDRISTDAHWLPATRFLIRTLTRTPVLCAVAFPPTELLQQQLEKLAVNSVLNPLTSLLDNRNGSILYNFAITRTMRLMLAETSLVIRSLPELQSIPNINQRFSAARLENIVVNVAEKTKDNISSMLADVRAGRRTEIEYINGYIVKRGEEIGIKCVVNYAVMQIVMGKRMMTSREQQFDVPMASRDLHGES